MKRITLLALTTSVVVSSFAFMAGNALAIPVFARKYNQQCNMCHTVPPRLNKFGVAFKQNGFELPPGTVLPENEVYGNQVLTDDLPKAIVGAGFPFMIRTGIHTEVSGTSVLATQPNGTNAPLGIVMGEFGLIGGGSVETPLGGLGYWVDAPGAIIGALELDMNFNPLCKVTVSNAIAPQVGYGIGLPILGLSANTVGTNNIIAAAPAPISVDRNEAATTSNGLFTWGNNSLPGVEIRGTTDAATGLGLNYAIGYMTQGVGNAVGNNANGLVGGQNGSAFYLSGSYFLAALNTNLTIGYSSENLTVAGALAPGPAPTLPPAATQTMVSAAWNVGENLQATLTYNSFGGVNAPVFSGVMGPGGGILPPALTTDGYTSVITFAPEYLFTPQFYVGGRISSATGAGIGTNGALTATPNATVMSIGFGYKLLQNVQLYINYTSKDDGSGGKYTNVLQPANVALGAVAGTNLNSGSSIVAGVDFVM